MKPEVTRWALLASRFTRAWRQVYNKTASNDFLLALTVVTVVTTVGIGFSLENNKLIPLNGAGSAHYLLESSNRLSFLANWDGRDYLDIAVNGYQGKAETNFFPLYPMLVHMVKYVVRSLLWSGLLVSWSAFVGGVYMYLKVVKQLYRTRRSLEALRAVLFFVLFPTGVFLFAVYTEALFALLALGAVYFALQRRPFEAGVLTLLATATHETGVFVVALVMLLLWEQREKLSRIAAAVAIGCLGIVSYMVFLFERFGNPFAFVASQQGHGWLDYGHRLLAQLPTREGLFALLALSATWYWWRRRKSFAVYSALYACIVLLGNLGGFGRYVLMDFPLQLMVYEYLRRRNFAYAVALAASAVCWMYFLLQFAGGYTGG